MSEDVIVSPVMLWRDFSPELKEPDISVIKEKTENGRTEKSLYFTALTAPDGKVRVYCELLYSEKCAAIYDDKMPVAVLCGDLSSPNTLALRESLAERSFAVLTYDFLGRTDGGSGRHTIYPESLSYANFDAASGDLYGVKGSAKDTCWYMWNAVTRYVLSLIGELDGLDASRVGIVGTGLGGNLAYQLAAIDERIKTAAVIGSSGEKTFELQQTGLFDDEHSKFIYSLSSLAYAKLLKKPLLLHLGTNAEDSGFDRGADIFGRLPAKLLNCLSVSPYMRKTIGYRQRENLFLWLEYHLLNDGVFPSRPGLELFPEDDKLFARLTADGAASIKSAEIYYAYDTDDSTIRNWSPLSPENLGDGKYVSRLSVIRPGQSVYAFGIVNYENGISAATTLIKKSTKGMALSLSLPASSRLIYDSKNEYDCFTSFAPDAVFNTEKELTMSEGPLGITGIKSNIGDLATYKISDPKYYGYDNDLLQMNVYSPDPQAVSVEMLERRGGVWGKTYTAKVQLSGGELWQKLTLSLRDFKTSEGVILETWEDMAFLVLKKEKDMLLNSLIWA